ncbi:MAG: lipoprotein [Gammaproteobacteria bacterium]|nr:lipoprotein [Gammaproteobacteria bacterium]
MKRARGLLWPMLIAAGLTAAVTGCGQKGDLYLPKPQEQQRGLF